MPIQPDPLPVKGFIECSLMDYPWEEPGALIFLAGCDARCPYCQAAALVAGGAALPSIRPEEVLASLEELRGFVRGVTITGGEVSLHANLAPRLLRPVRRMGFPVRLDTYGARPGRVNGWVSDGYVQHLAVDVKGPWRRYPDILGIRMSGTRIQQVRRWIRGLIEDQTEVTCEFRTTVHPQLLTVEEILVVARQIAGAHTFVLQNYKPVEGFDASLKLSPGYEDATLRELAESIRARGLAQRCFVRGYEQDCPDTESVACAC